VRTLLQARKIDVKKNVQQACDNTPTHLLGRLIHKKVSEDQLLIVCAMENM
jgi:hypothetical protein